MGEENINNNGCDQFTRPEEILELQKYLRAIKEELAERTELGTDVIRMDSSYRAGEINLNRGLSSTGRVATNMNPESERIDFSNAILGVPLEGFPEKEIGLGEDLEKINQEGHRDINKLPDTIDTINVERIERLEKVREKLVGADTNSPRELETYVEKLDVAPERINLGTELEKIIGETKDINLSQERVDLVEPKFIDSLGTEKEKIKGEIPELTLGEGRDRIPFLETKIDQLPNNKEPLKSNQGISQENIELSNAQSPLPEDQGMMFDPTQEDLPDAVLGIPGELNDIELEDIREDLPREGEIKDLSLSDFLDRIKGEDKDLSQLLREITSGGNIPQGQKEINELRKTIPNDGLITGEDNLPDSLDSFLTGQGIIPGSLEDIERLNTDLPEGSYIEGELKNPNLHDNLPENGYIEGEQKNPNLDTELYKGGYIEGELKNPNLDTELHKGGYVEGEQKNPTLHDKLPDGSYMEGELKNPTPGKELSKDGYVKGELKNLDLDTELHKRGYIEGELKNPDLHSQLPEDSYVGGEQKNPNLDTELHKGGYIEGELKNPNLDTELYEDGYIEGEFGNIDELRTKLPKDGKTKGEFEDIDRLANKLPKKDGKVRGEFEDIDRLANKLPKKDGKVRGEFEDIDKLSRKLPKKDGYTRGDFKKIKELTEELPYPDGYPDGDFKEVGKLTKKLPADGYVDGKFVDLGEELPEELPEGGLIEGDFKKLPEELTKELPEGGTIDKEDLVKIKSLPEELSPDGKIDEEDLVEIKRLPKDIAPDGKIEGEPYEIERLTKKLPKDGKADGDFVEIDRLKKTLPEGGKIEGKPKTINELPDEFEEGGLIQGEFRKLGDLSKEIPLGGLIEGDFKNPKPIEELPKDGKLDEEDLVKIKKLPKELPVDGHIGEGDIIQFQKLPKELPTDGHIGEEGVIKIKKLPEELPTDGHIGEEGIVQFPELPSDLPNDGHIGKEGIVEFQNLPKELTEDGISKGDRKDIQELDSFLSDDGYIEGDFKELNLSDVLPDPDGYTQGDLPDISELDKVLAAGGLIHGGETGPFSEETSTEELYQYYSKSNDDIFSITGGTIPEITIPEKDSGKHTTPEELYEKYSGRNSGGTYIDPITREVNTSGRFQIPDGAIVRDTFSQSDPMGEYNLYARRHPLELDNSEFDDIGGLIPKSTIPEADNWQHRSGNQLDNKKFDEIDGLIPDSTIPEADNWQHRDGNQLDNKKFDEIDGLIPDSTIPEGDDWEHLDPIDRINFYNKSKIREKSVDPKTKEREYKGEFSIEEGIVPDSEIPKGDIWEHEDFEKQFKLYEDSAVRIESVDANGNTKYKGEFKFKEGVVPENTRPEGAESTNADPKLYEWLRSLEKIDAGAGDLYHALLERAGHNLTGYYDYLVNYAEHKDLSSGWGQKIAALLSELKGDLSIDKYRNFDEQLSEGVMAYYEKEGRVKLMPSSFPESRGDWTLGSYLSASGYLRYLADLVRTGQVWGKKTSGYGTDSEYGGHPEDNSRNNTWWSKLQGKLGLQEEMLDKVLMELVNLRDKGERETKSNRDRLPGGTGILQQAIMDTDVIKTITNVGRSIFDKIRSNAKGSSHGDTTQPFNRPVVDEISYDPDWDLNHSYDNFGNYTNTIGWYDPFHEDEKGKGKTLNPFKAVKDVLSNSKTDINYRFDENYLKGAGIRTTLFDLAEHNLGSDPIESVEGLMQVIRQSPLISEPSKFILAPSDNSGHRRKRTTTLDTNNYWEIVIEPYLGLDNGFCSYLPCVDEINVINRYTHGAKTFYTRWIPVVSFDLSRSRTSSKSIGLFGGEFTIPGGVEYSNELRITILDDVYKSWRRYFEKCADVGVYNSEVHSMDYYGYSDEGVLSLDNWSIGRDLSGNLADRVTVVDKTSFALAPYKNIAFRIRIYIMTPQFSTINKYDLLATLKEVSIERSGDIDPGSQDLELSFSIVGETNEDFLNKKTSILINFDKSQSKYKDKIDYDEWGKSGGKTEAQRERDELEAKKKTEKNANNTTKSSGRNGNSSRKTGSGRRRRGSSKTTAKTAKSGRGVKSYRKGK